MALQTQAAGVAPAVVRECPDIESSTEEYAQRFEGPAGEYLLQVQNEAVLRLSKPWSGGKVLDVGGGHAQLCLPLLDAKCEVTVLGSEASCLQRPRQIARERISCIVGNLLEPPFPDQSFDLVIAIRMLAHIRDTGRFIRELCRVARHAVVVDYPEIRSINAITPALYGLKKKLEGDTRRYHTYRGRALTSLFAENGFGKPKALNQFFWPMVVHRKIGRPAASKILEVLPRALGLTAWFGSPVLLRTTRM